MYFFTLIFWVIGLTYASHSKLIPVFIDASEAYLDHQEDRLFLRPDIRSALNVLKEKKIDRGLLSQKVANRKRHWPLREDDIFDAWPKTNEMVEGPRLALHAHKMTVIEQTDDWTKDDIYIYFFVTDGVIPTGKVTSVYKSLAHGQSFFFNDKDRRIFPLGALSERPKNHLIIDYTLVESDGDDIKEMQKLSELIIDLAIAVYSTYKPDESEVLISLRKEVKALSDFIFEMDNDDRLVSGTIAYKVSELSDMLKDKSFVEISKKHKSKSEFDDWEYKIYFQFLKDSE